MFCHTGGECKLILMTRDFDVIRESGLRPSAFGEAEFINVGWGKKETQFHGSLGKTAAQTVAGVSTFSMFTTTLFF